MGGGGGLLVLASTGILTQESDPDGKTLVDSWNGLNELSRLAIMWAMQHRKPAGARFSFNCYKHWVQILLR